MAECKYYTTIGQVQDYIVEKCQKNNNKISFPAALGEMRIAGLLQTAPPPTPPFHSGLDMGAFLEYVRGLRVYADAILPQAFTYARLPVIEEDNMFPDGKDVFAFLNMPYMTEELHFHNFFEITYVLKGSCTFLFEGESATLYPGDLCIVSPRSGHSLPLKPDCAALSVVVRKSTFDVLFANLLTQQDLVSLFFRNSLYETKRANYILLKTGNDPMSYQTMQQLVSECNTLDKYANDCAGSLLNLFLARALRAASAAITLYHYEGYSERDFDFALVLQYIQQNYRTVTLTGLAQTFHFSQTYLSKLFRKNLGLSFTEVLRNLKMNHGLELLMNTPMKISEIAEAVGYESVDHFSRTFRKVYHTPPLEYRRRHAGGEWEPSAFLPYNVTEETKWQ